MKWVKPCGKHPNGLKVTIAGGQLLDMDEHAGDILSFSLVIFRYPEV